MKLFIAILIAVAPLLATAQLKLIKPVDIDSNQQEVLDVVLTLFDGMREADSAKVHSAFANDPQLYTSFTNKEGQAILRKDRGLQHRLSLC